MAARDYIPLNLALLSHPMNWLIIWLMVVIAGLGISLIFPPAASTNSDA